MGMLFGKKEPNTFKELIKEKNKQDKKIEKQWKDRMNTKYTAENLKAAKKMMVANAMEIDKLEYEKIAKELKEKLNK
jgi:fructose-1-phosphate kinase PfkB-like protein